MPPSASVVVPVFDGEHVVTEQLDALHRQTCRSALEIIVVDDGSLDSTADVVDAWIRSTGDPEFRLVRRRERGGPNAARNVGLGLATCELVLFCDGDDVVDDRWATTMIEAFRPGTILAGRYLRLGGNLAEPGDWLLRTGAMFGWAFAPGGNLGVDRSLALSIGGFDESIKLGGTEVEFCIRAQLNANAELVRVDDAIVNYRPPGGMTGNFSRAFRRERGHAYIEQRYGSRITRRGRTAYSWVARRIGSCAKRMCTGRPFVDDLSFALGRLLGLVYWAAYYRVRAPRPTLMASPDRPRRD